MVKTSNAGAAAEGQRGAAWSMSERGYLSDLSAKVLNSSEDAHLKSMSSFETDEQLQATPSLSARVQVSKHARPLPASLGLLMR